jgi:hypothetical protein
MEIYEIAALILTAGILLIYGSIKKGLVDIFSKRFQVWFKERFEGDAINREFNSVYERLVELRTTLKADRVFIHQFHNGNFFSNKQPIWKFSRSYEVTAQGVSYESQNNQNVMAISVWDSISGMWDSKLKKYCERLKGTTCGECKNPFGIYLYRVDKMPESYSKVVLRNQGVVAYIHGPIVEDGDHLVGILGIEYLDGCGIIDDPCLICQKVQEISFFLNKG